MASFEDTVELAVQVAVKRAVEDAVPSAVDKLVDSTKAAVRADLFPVGSYYITESSANPADIFGGTWTKKGQGRCLWGADDSHAAGTTIAAGLPNITGTFDGNVNDGTTRKTGAFYTYNYNNSGADGGSGGGTVGFDASRSNAIYGRSTTVQPPALVVNIWVRTA
jgi:hypothetical protein